MPQTKRFLSMREVVALTTYSRPSIYRLIERNGFPKPIKLGDVKIAFVAAEVETWLASRPRALGGEATPERASQAA
jgi:prophage regulatory protein